MRYSADNILSFLSNYGISLSDSQLAKLQEQLEVQGRLIEPLNREDEVGNFALQPKWATLNKSLTNQDLPSNAGSTWTDFSNQDKKTSPPKATQKSLATIHSYPSTNVFIQVFEDRASKEAEELKGSDRSELPLWGTTAAIKDLIAISGHPMTAGSVVFDKSPYGFEAPAVSRLRKAGAVVIGATNLHELAFGTTSENPHYGTVANPINQSYLAGGSSGGSAAAVGFGMSSFALGTDTGGSVRIPAACCGIVGYKPSFGLLPLKGIFPLGYTLDHVGPLAGSVKQVALVAEIMADQPGLFTSDLEGSIDNLKVGVPANFFLEGINKKVKAAYHKALDKLNAEGADLIPVKLPSHKLAPSVYLCTSGPEAVGVHFHRLIKQGSKLGEDVYNRLLAGLFIPAYLRVKAQRVRHKMFSELSQVFKKIDVLATPTLQITVPQRGQETAKIDGHALNVGRALLRNTSPFNLTGVPAITIPFDKDQNGMPFSLQLTAHYGKDRHLLKASHTIEQLLP